jgi:hypothetical protein
LITAQPRYGTLPLETMQTLNQVFKTQTDSYKFVFSFLNHRFYFTNYDIITYYLNLASCSEQNKLFKVVPYRGWAVIKSDAP